jgi:hypothetical protein
MTAFTINGGAVTNWDTLSGGSVNATLDTYTISNGTTLLIDTDSYQCANHSTAFGSLDIVSYIGVGGKLKIDGTSVRVIAFTAGSGTVPAVGTTITQGGVSSYFLGVWSGWGSEPLAAAAAMPATGFIKVKAKTGGSYAAGALTGITATASGPDVVGWIEVRGAETAAITIPRIGAFEVVGDWFELGTTNGVRGQSFACPTTQVLAGVFPGVWIESAAGSGVYEQFAGCGSMVNSATTPTDVRGKIVWHTAGNIRIGNDSVNNVGFLPPTGCRVRIPNVILTNCTRTVSGSGARVVPNATLATRQEFVTTSAGDISISHCVMQWYGNFLQAYRANVSNSAFSDSLILQEISSALSVDNVIVSPTQAQLNFALNAVSCFSGGTIQNCLFARFSLAAAAAYVNQCNYLTGVTFSNVKSLTLTNRANASTGTWQITQNADCNWLNCTAIGGQMLHTGSQRPTITNLGYADNFSGTTPTTNAQYVANFGSGCVGATVNGIHFLGLSNVQAYLGLMNVTGCYNSTLRNVGTRAAPLDLGATNGGAVIVNAAGNCDGIRVQRVYCSNTRTGLWAFLNSDNNVTLQDVAGDYADTTVIASLNTVCKGAGLTGATTGQVSVYGTHWMDKFTAATTGRIEISCNEPTAASAAQCAITSGLPQFNSSGQVALTIVGQQVTWEMPDFAKGHTATANLAPTLTGTNTGNLTYEFQYNLGSGYNGSWLTLSAANWFAVGTINPAIGLKIKVRATCATANAGNLLTNISLSTVTTSIAQGGNQYPLDSNTVTFTGLLSGTDVFVLSAGTTTILDQLDSIPGTSSSFTYSGAQTVDVGFIKTGYVPLYLRGVALTTVNSAIPVAQTPDRNYI